VSTSAGEEAKQQDLSNNRAIRNIRRRRHPNGATTDHLAGDELIVHKKSFSDHNAHRLIILVTFRLEQA